MIDFNDVEELQTALSIMRGTLAGCVKCDMSLSPDAATEIVDCIMALDSWSSQLNDWLRKL